MARLLRLLAALVLTLTTVTAGQSVRCLMDRHDCCGTQDVSFASTDECPLVAPAAPRLDRTEPHHELALVPPVQSADLPAAAIAALSALTHEPETRASPPGTLVLRV